MRLTFIKTPSMILTSALAWKVLRRGIDGDDEGLRRLQRRILMDRNQKEEQSEVPIIRKPRISIWLKAWVGVSLDVVASNDQTDKKYW
jgi:hypothetical protein